MKVLTHKRYGGLYDFDESANILSKVLKCYHEGDSFTLDRLNYQYNQGEYREANETDWNLYGESYYLKADKE